MMSASILAATFTIAFEGLMLFQTDGSGARHAAILHAMYHDRQHIEIWSYPYPASPQQDNPRIIPLERYDRVTFLNVPRGYVDTDDFYEEHVPHLPEYIVRGRVSDSVVGEAKNEGTWAFVDLPAGDATTYGTFGEKVELTNRNGAKKRRCFARFVVMAPVDPVGPPYLIITHESLAQSKIEPYAIKNDDLIIVSNISLDEQHPHFSEYDNLLITGGKVGRADRLPYDACPLFVDNTSIPPAVKTVLRTHNPAPRGDCGPTGNP